MYTLYNYYLFNVIQSHASFHTVVMQRMTECFILVPMGATARQLFILTNEACAHYCLQQLRGGSNTVASSSILRLPLIIINKYDEVILLYTP